MPALETVHTDATFRIVYSRNVQVTAMSHPPTAEQMRMFGRAGTALGRRHPSGAALINLITGDKADFSEDMREETVRLMKRPDLSASDQRTPSWSVGFPAPRFGPS